MMMKTIQTVDLNQTQQIKCLYETMKSQMLTRLRCQIINCRAQTLVLSRTCEVLEELDAAFSMGSRRLVWKILCSITLDFTVFGVINSPYRFDIY